jgi:hypothetical protein
MGGARSMRAVEDRQTRLVGERKKGKRRLVPCSPVTLEKPAGILIREKEPTP